MTKKIKIDENFDLDKGLNFKEIVSKMKTVGEVKKLDEDFNRIFKKKK